MTKRKDVIDTRIRNIVKADNGPSSLLFFVPIYENTIAKTKDMIYVDIDK